MADATVPRVQREDVLPLPADVLPLPAEAAPASFTRSVPTLPRPLMLLWAGMVVAIVGFLVLGSPRIGAGNWIGRRMPVPEIWRRFLGFLTEQGAAPALVIAVIVAAAVAFVGAAAALWLALGLRDAQPGPLADEPDGE